MAWERPPTESGPARAEFGAESPEAVEARKHKWRRLRSFALAASLLLNGGFLAERAMHDAKLDKLEGDLEAGGGLNFVVQGAEKGAFQVTRGTDGNYELQGTLRRDGREVKVRYRLPASENMKNNIADLQRGNAVDVLNKMIEIATTGSLTTRDPDTGVTYENTFDQGAGGSVTSRQVTYDREGNVSGASEMNVGMTEAPDNFTSGGGSGPNPLPGGIPPD